METALKQRRNVYPRWRALERTPGEELSSLSNFKSLVDQSRAEDRLRFFYEKWRETPTLENAVEVIDCAVLVKNPLLAIGPAKAVLQSNAMPAAKAVANFVLDGPHVLDPELETAEQSRDVIRTKIRSLKVRASEEPRNAFLWLEKARLHTLLGDIESGRLSMRRAVGCAPEDRVILRALARFMVHIGQPAEGHDILRKSSRLKADPWLQAAEIALADLSERDPVSLRRARSFLDDETFAPIHLSELASAVGTVEAREGNRLARKRIRQSLRSPTENALSQAFWVREELDLSVPIQKSMLAIKGAFEARVRAALEAKSWTDAIENCRRWLADEPFSIRAATEGSFIASTFWSNNDALRICDVGLIANPDEQTLLNNKIVALCRLKKLDAAKQTLDRLMIIVGKDPDPYIQATIGLFNFASGRPDEGRQYYLKAVEKARRDRASDTEFRALAHWLFEELAAGTIPIQTGKSVFAELTNVPRRKRVRPISIDILDEFKARLDSLESQNSMPVDEQLTFSIMQQIKLSEETLPIPVSTTTVHET